MSALAIVLGFYLFIFCKFRCVLYHGGYAWGFLVGLILRCLPKMRAIAHAHAKECNCDYCNWEAVGCGDNDIKLLVDLKRFIEEYCIVGVYSIKGEVNSFTNNSTWWSRVVQ